MIILKMFFFFFFHLLPSSASCAAHTSTCLRFQTTARGYGRYAQIDGGSAEAEGAAEECPQRMQAGGEALP